MKNNMRAATDGLAGLNLLREKTRSGGCKGYSRMWFIVLLLVVLVAGCGGGSSSSGGPLAPAVSSTVPADLAPGVAIDPNITAIFNKAMDPSTITTTTFTVTGPGLTPVEGTVALTADGLTAVFTPTLLLTADITYTAKLTTEVKDLSGMALAAEIKWSFTTSVTPTLSPTVVSTDPPDFATDVATDKLITATFSVAMDPATIVSPTAKNFTVAAGPGLISVGGTVTLSADAKTATFTPAAALAPNTQFLAKVTTGARDVSGNPMKSDKLWVFQTGP